MRVRLRRPGPNANILEKERVRKTSRRAKFAQTTLKKPKHKTDLKFRRFSPTANMSTGIDDDFMTSVRLELLKETFRDRENARTKPTTQLAKIRSVDNVFRNSKRRILIFKRTNAPIGALDVVAIVASRNDKVVWKIALRMRFRK